MVADMEVDMMADMEVDKVVDKIADMMADMEVHKVVDKVADMVANDRTPCAPRCDKKRAEFRPSVGPRHSEGRKVYWILTIE